jgi:alpha-N-arabinofuranosidase
LTNVKTSAQTTYTINTNNVQHKIDEKIYGHFLEHIYHSVNNGLWGDLVWNRSFEMNSGRDKQWSIEDTVLIQSSLATNVRLMFGETAWADYEITLQAKKTGGYEGFLILFRANGENFYWANFGGWNNTQHAIEKGVPGTRWSIFGSPVAGQITSDVWYDIRIVCDSNHFQVWLDEVSVFDFTDTNSHLTGQVGVGTWSTQAEYKNILVTELESGDTLFSGLPDVEEETESEFPNWEKTGDVYIFNSDSALNSEYSIRIVNDSNTMGGIKQDGLSIKNQEYTGSFWAKGNVDGGISIRLQDGDTELGRKDFASVPEIWTEFSFELTPSTASDNGTLEISFSDSGTVYIDQVSMMGNDSKLNDGFRPDLLDAVADLKPPIIRWPGGCYVSAYFWKDGIGPQKDRETYQIELWDDRDVNSYGTDEFMTMCDRLGIEPLIVVNTGILDRTCGIPMTKMLSPEEYLQDALDWMEYCNGDPDTTVWGAVRAANGHREPYNVKYWEIDNETWGAGIDAYNEKVKIFAPAMKAKYPDIKIIACGSGSFDRSWNLSLLNECAGIIDYISTHHYESADDYIGGVDEYENFIIQLGIDIENSSNPDVKIYMSEWNTLPGTNWQSGLYAGGLLNGFERQGEHFEISGPALFLRHESAGGNWNNAFINFNNESWFPAPNYIVMKLWRDYYAPNFLETTGVNSDINIVSTLSEDSSYVVVKLVNTGSVDQSVSLEFDTLFSPGTTEVKVVTAPSIYAENSYQNPDNIHVTDGIATVENREVMFTSPANSALVIKINHIPDTTDIPDTTSGVNSLSVKQLYLYNSAPNPFRNETSIKFEITRDQHVQLRILDVSGKVISVLVNKEFMVGKHVVKWNGTDKNGNKVGKGVYFYELSTSSRRIIKKLIFM